MEGLWNQAQNQDSEKKEAERKKAEEELFELFSTEKPTVVAKSTQKSQTLKKKGKKGLNERGENADDGNDLSHDEKKEKSVTPPSPHTDGPFAPEAAFKQRAPILLTMMQAALHPKVVTAAHSSENKV